eukprot:5862039-Prymnesium_polylepis.1
MGARAALAQHLRARPPPQACPAHPQLAPAVPPTRWHPRHGCALRRSVSAVTCSSTRAMATRRVSSTCDVRTDCALPHSRPLHLRRACIRAPLPHSPPD